MRILMLVPVIAAAAAVYPVMSSTIEPGVAVVQANDNRVAAGMLRDGVLTIAIDAQLAAWKADLNVDSMATVQAFGERGKSPSIPGPLIRIPLGTEIRASLRNTIPDSMLIVHGLRAGDPASDTIQIAPGATREISFKPAAAGTYLYWGTTSRSTIRGRWGREALLNGAIVVDAPGESATGDRILVLSLIDIFPDSVRNPAKEDVWELSINGRSWPHTERLNHQVGDSIRWRVINATDRVHPMHLHGFHFRTLAKGDWTRDTTYRAEDVAYAVTEFMLPGSTARIEWTPTRAGNWLFHCHMTPHITPYPERHDSVRTHDAHDVIKHPEQAMAGLVLGVTVTDPSPKSETFTVAHRERVFAQQAPSDSGKKARRGFVIQRGAEPRRDSVEIPGTPLILYRGERTAVTVINRLPRATTVHWHGMELESLFDGVSGWSGIGGSRAPLVLPGDSFTVAFTPPRAGTFMYHTHMDEEDQMASGLYAPMIVLEPGEKFDATRDIVVTFGAAVVGGKEVHFALNGLETPKPLELVAGETYRFRLINIHPVVPARFTMMKDTVPVMWRAVSKDGAKLPAGRTAPRRATVFMGVGETYDFEFTPSEPMQARLLVANTGRETFSLAQPIIVRARSVTSVQH